MPTGCETLRVSANREKNLLFLLFVFALTPRLITIQDIKPGSQSMSPSLIILCQSIVYPEVVAKQTGPTGETTDSPLRLLNP